jgi:hypothetical protein
MEEDWSVVRSLSFTPEEKRFLTDNKVQIAQGFCRQCSECVPGCSRGVDIPTLMRVHMYTASYRNFQHARQTLEEIPEDRAIGACVSCAGCTVRCAHGVDVRERLEDLRALYA